MSTRPIAHTPLEEKAEALMVEDATKLARKSSLKWHTAVNTINVGANVVCETLPCLTRISQQTVKKLGSHIDQRRMLRQILTTDKGIIAMRIFDCQYGIATAFEDGQITFSDCVTALVCC